MNVDTIYYWWKEVLNDVTSYAIARSFILSHRDREKLFKYKEKWIPTNGNLGFGVRDDYLDTDTGVVPNKKNSE